MSETSGIHNIVYVTSTPFPYGSASSARTMNMVKLLTACGYFVTVVADYKCGEDKTFRAEYLSEKNCEQKELSLKCVERLKTLHAENKIDAVITNAVYYKVNALTPFCRQNGVKLIIESCEWYDKSNYRLGCINPHYIRNQRMLKRLFKKADGFISISRFLHERNSSLNKPSVRIPTIVDKSAFDCDFHGLNKKIILSYCGNPGPSKELLAPIIDAIKSSKKYSDKIEFHVYGPSKEQVLENKGVKKDDINLNFLFIHGKVPQRDMHEVFKKSDFLIFIRPNRRSSNAGFPTKLAESMIAATPVIANATGDIALYLNSANGFLLKDALAKSVAECLDKILTLSSDEYDKMRRECRVTAENGFDYGIYKDDLMKFFDKVQGD